MTPPESNGIPPEFDARAERASFSAAREHVGAAGLEQFHILEQTIAAGRKQIGTIQSLRPLLASTLEQQRELSLAELGASTSVQQAKLQEIMASGQTQLASAHTLRLTIQRALAEVRNTPLEYVSGHVLTTLSAAVHQQTQDLQDILEAAVGQASSLEQLDRLQQIRTQTSIRLQAVERTRSENDLVELERQALQALNHIRRLEREGQTHAVQKEELGEEAQIARQHIAELEEANVLDQREIPHLEEERDGTLREQRELNRASEQLQQALEDLRHHTVEPEA